MTHIADSFARQTALTLAMDMIDSLAYRLNGGRSVMNITISPTAPEVSFLTLSGERSTGEAQLRLAAMIVERLGLYIHPDQVFVPDLFEHGFVFGPTRPVSLTTQLLFTALNYAIKTRTPSPAPLPAAFVSLADFEKFRARVRVRVGFQVEVGFDTAFAEARDAGNLTARFFATLAPSD